MLSAFGLSLRIAVSSTAVSVLRLSRWRGAPVTLLAEQALTLDANTVQDNVHNAAHDGMAKAIAEAITTMLAALHSAQKLGRWPLSIVLADELTRLWRVTPPPAAARLADIEAAAGLRFQALYGETPAAWQITGDWNASHAFLAAAMPRALLSALAQVAQAYQLPLVAVEPHVVSVYNRWRRSLQSGAWLGLVHEQVLTLVAIADDDAGRPGIQALRTVALPAAAAADVGQDWLSASVRREALLLDLAMPTLLQVCGAVPPQWSKPPAKGAHAANGNHIACALLDGGQRGALAGWSSIAQLALAGSAV